eukprot:CAMPEP_0206601648 /NCGR_PEP_ID=MMETSP0325_2-20121206/46779_1 /ASSEMBLY_ACC=CAM_ASM_000347 /TAXON_ID=2866 /ORGANISM="Crypthecodinium cohnii, Strain Seligo" /LENGTH=236 /DNA_ID=CAMNT_0054113709 /DNA_START=169 /DNA_END=875 /DNA_ORIENTATION=-
MSCNSCCVADTESSFDPAKTTSYHHAQPDVEEGYNPFGEFDGAGSQHPGSSQENRGSSPTSFEAQITFDKGLSGWQLDSVDGNRLRILEVFPTGPVAEYNASVEPERQIMPGDFVVEVNGMSKSALDMCRLMQSAGSVRLQVRRPEVFQTVSLPKGEGQIGLDLSYHPQGRSLIIRDLCEAGMIPTYNQSAARADQIHPGDYILAVNGTTGTPQELVKELTSAKMVALRVSRPATS